MTIRVASWLTQPHSVSPGRENTRYATAIINSDVLCLAATEKFIVMVYFEPRLALRLIIKL
jgi:hypothetical protein